MRVPWNSMKIEGQRRALATIAFAQLFALSLWFSASAVAGSLKTAWNLTDAQLPLLTLSVQVGFVVGALLSALLNLADRIQGAGPLYRALPSNQPRLHRSEVIQLQELLLAKGFEVGEIDGLLGPASRAALREFQMDAGLIADGFPDRKTLAKLGVGDYQ